MERKAAVMINGRMTIARSRTGVAKGPMKGIRAPARISGSRLLSVAIVILLVVPSLGFLLFLAGCEYLAPGRGEIGSTVTIYSRPEARFGGTQGEGGVYFGDTPAQVQAWSRDTITATVPCVPPGAHAVKVRTDGGQEYTCSGMYTVTSTFGITPTAAQKGDRVTMVGSGMGTQQAWDNRVMIGGRIAEIVSWSPSSITAYVPEGLQPGSAEISVWVAGEQKGTGAVTIEADRDVVITDRTRCWIDYPPRPGYDLHLYGSGFGGYDPSYSRVTFGGNAAQEIVSWSDTEIYTTIPYVRSGDVEVVVETEAARSNAILLEVGADLNSGDTTQRALDLYASFFQDIADYCATPQYREPFCDLAAAVRELCISGQPLQDLADVDLEIDALGMIPLLEEYAGIEPPSPDGPDGSASASSSGQSSILQAYLMDTIMIRFESVLTSLEGLHGIIELVHYIHMLYEIAKEYWEANPDTAPPEVRVSFNPGGSVEPGERVGINILARDRIDLDQSFVRGGVRWVSYRVYLAENPPQPGGPPVYPLGEGIWEGYRKPGGWQKISFVQDVPDDAVERGYNALLVQVSAMDDCDNETIPSCRFYLPLSGPQVVIEFDQEKALLGDFLDFTIKAKDPKAPGPDAGIAEIAYDLRIESSDGQASQVFSSGSRAFSVPGREWAEWQVHEYIPVSCAADPAYENGASIYVDARAEDAGGDETSTSESKILEVEIRFAAKASGMYDGEPCGDIWYGDVYWRPAPAAPWEGWEYLGRSTTSMSPLQQVLVEALLPAMPMGADYQVRIVHVSPADPNPWGDATAQFNYFRSTPISFLPPWKGGRLLSWNPAGVECIYRDGVQDIFVWSGPVHGGETVVLTYNACATNYP